MKTTGFSAMGPARLPPCAENDRLPEIGSRVAAMMWSVRHSAREARCRGAAVDAEGPASVRSLTLRGALRGFASASGRRDR